MDSSGSSRFLIDGFPRNLNNLEGWERVIGDSSDVLFVLFFDCPEDCMESRLVERGKTSGRTDDNIETIKRRLLFCFPTMKC
jgi:UMP-CMP kinase